MEIISTPWQRGAASLRSLFVGDALAMPVHWFYNPLDILKQFPDGITKFEAAPDYHPSSIMSLHSTKRGGRGSRNHDITQPDIVGDVILKGKRQYWEIPNTHYHRGMQAGENTLNAHCARVVMRTLASKNGHYDEELFLNAYIDLMTATPALHPDTYAESYHRGFFANLTQGKPKNQCAAVTHDTPSIGALVTLAPIVISERLRGTGLDKVKIICHQHLQLTHPDKSLAKVCGDYTELLDALLFRRESEPAREIIAAWANRSSGIAMPELIARTESDYNIIGGLFSPACYISDSWPGVLYLACKYATNPEAGLLSNTNLGGDNVHRGAVLGAILGLANGHAISNLYYQLSDKVAIEQEIQALIGC